MTTLEHPTVPDPTTLHAPAPGGRREPLDPRRLRAVRTSYTTRHVADVLDRAPSGYHLVSGPLVRPRAGQLVVARVVSIGRHRHLESPVSRRQLLYPGQEVLLAYGSRYAPDQFLARVPADLSPCHLVAAGGVAGEVLSMHSSIQGPTLIEPVGLLADDDGVLDLLRFAAHRGGVPRVPARRRPVIAVLGTSMSSGKSTTLASLVNGLSRSGSVVGAGKVTGTGAGNDPHGFRDAGAARVLDFTDFGRPTTFGLDDAAVADLLVSMVATLEEDGPDVVLVEIADGLYQQETRRLLESAEFRSVVDGVVFAAQDALGAASGVARLTALGQRVIGVSGLVTASPLSAAEAAAGLGVPVVGTFDLREPAVAGELLARVTGR